MPAFFLGVTLGFLGSVPAAGPLALAIVAAALQGERRRALRLAASGALAESLWAALAVTGAGVASAGPTGMAVLRVIGAGVLALLGVAMWRSPLFASKRPDETTLARASDLTLGFSVVATNPAFLVIWTGFAVTVRGTPFLPHSPAWAMVAGAFVGIVGWFSTLFAIVSSARDRLSLAMLGLLTRALGLVVLGFAVALALSAFRSNG